MLKTKEPELPNEMQELLTDLTHPLASEVLNKPSDLLG